MVDRVLLIINSSSGTGHGESLLNQLPHALSKVLGETASLRTDVVTDHPQTKSCAKAFLGASSGSAAVIAAGGGGTLRAVIEAVCEVFGAGPLPGGERVQVTGLRMGSGNVVAKLFGVPLDPMEAIQGIGVSLRTGRFAPCCVICCRIDTPERETLTRYAVTMCGLGQFGRTSGDLARWHKRLPGLRRFATRFVKLESLNNVEYGLAVFVRALWCTLWPKACETVEVEASGERSSLRLLAGVALNFPIGMLPFDPGVRVEDPALSLHLIPQSSRFESLALAFAPHRLVNRARKIRIGPENSVELRITDRDTMEFFLDEDPEVAYRKLTIQVAGTLAFVPGPGYARPQEGAAHP